MPWSSPHLSLHFGPTEGGAPDALAEPILDLIGRASDTLLVATQQLEHASVVAALLRARSRGVKVRVLLEHDYLTEPEAVDDPLAPSGRNETNREVLSTLYRARIPVRADRTSRLQHTNVLVADGSDALLTSANLTPTGLHANLNHAVRVHDEAIAQAFTTEFEANWADERGSPHGPEPTEVFVDGVRVRVVFGPDHGPEMEVMKQVLKARQTLDFSIFTFSGSSGIDDALIGAHDLGVRVRGVMDGGQGAESFAATPALVEAGIDLHLSKRGDGVRKLHHKLLVADGQVVVLGTFNFTRSAARWNDEALLVLGSPQAPLPTELVAYASDEIERVIRDRAGPADPA